MNPAITKRYIQKFAALKRATKNGVKTPHKPVLLLSVLQAIATGEITRNEIVISPALVARFKDNWQWLVKESFFTANFSLPFFHMSSEKFWHLRTRPGKEILLTSSHSIKSFAQLQNAVACAFLDEELFTVLQDKESRDLLFCFLLEHYFPHTPNRNSATDLLDTITSQILNEPAPVYRQLVEHADEEELFIRSGIFKKLIPSIYNFTCSISGMQISSNLDVQMVDACHIIPFAVSHDDTITNGISLSPTLHRAFDRGLIAIDNDYRVIVSSCFTETSADSFVKTYEGKNILLPKQQSRLPLIKNLEWHRENVFRGNGEISNAALSAL
jgi:putative restriction endonuclease